MPFESCKRQKASLFSAGTEGIALGRYCPGFWSTILEYFFLVPVPLRNHYEIKVYTFFSLVTSKSSA